MLDIPSPLKESPPPPPPAPTQKSNLSMLYYGLVVVGAAAILLAIYNLIIIKWCTHRRQGSSSGQQRLPTRLIEATATRRRASQQGCQDSSRNLLGSFRYKKDNSFGGLEGGSEYEYECSVCLSVFEEGEEVRQLPRCKHSFHAPCIDMWLYSHSDCPLCRAIVDPLPFLRRQVVVVDSSPENSREGMLDSRLPVSV